MTKTAASGIQKIAVLGGGLSSLSTVYHLTSQPDWKERFDITVYQTGWRLGGKGASGRDPENAHRIEEHGLHVWFGFYQNAFGMLRACYEENDRPASKKFSRMEQAFEPSHTCTTLERENGEWKPWTLHFPVNERRPGDPVPVPSPIDIVEALAVLMLESLTDAHVSVTQNNIRLNAAEKEVIGRLFLEMNDFFRKFSFFFGMDGISGVTDQKDQIRRKMREMKEKNDFSPLLLAVEKGREWFWDEISEKIDEYPNLRRLWILTDIYCSVIRGMIRDRVIYEGYEAINHYDLREWLERHCHTPRLTSESPLVQMLYSIVFAGQHQNTFEAGSGLQGTLRSLSYNGAYFYRMNAGMGDVVFAPLYEVLKKRGVKFRFFHKVEDIIPGAEGKSVERIRIGIQAHAKGGEYEPLTEVKGLPCWLNRPDFDQLEQGEELKRRGVNLEAEVNGWEAQEIIELECGKDFDEVVLGIPVAALKNICGDILRLHPRWAEMTQRITTSATQAFQVWLKPDLAGLGHPVQEAVRPLWGPYHQPFDTNCDLSNLIPQENWPAEQQPGTISYFCGKLDYTLTGDMEKDQRLGLASVRGHLARLIREGGPVFWPALKDDNGNIRWDLFMDLNGRDGEERLQGQYYRANTDPSELFTLSERGTSKYRMRAGETGIRNLTVCGDWTWTGLNVGCVEASVMSGMMASRELSGYPEYIAGEKTELLDAPGEITRTRNAIEEFGRAHLFTMFKAILT